MRLILDRVAVVLGAWALRRLFRADCQTDYRDDSEAGYCPSCEAQRLIAIMKGI